MLKDCREILTTIFLAAIKAVNGRKVVRNFLKCFPIEGDPIYLIAIGKAASSMAAGAQDFFAEKINQGIIITKKGHGMDLPFRCLEASHPIPDASSIKAGQELSKFISNIPSGAKVLFLLSGGASSLVEVLPPGWSLSQLQELNQWLLESGLSITEINQIRAACSLIKGGGLLQQFPKCEILQLIISDVPSNSFVEAGSGLLFPALRAGSLDIDFLQLPPWLAKFLKNVDIGLRKTTHLAKVTSHILSSIHDAIDAAAEKAVELGYQVNATHELITCDAEVAGKKLATLLDKGKPGLLIRGGETTIHLPVPHGIGGRNQHLALSAAITLANKNKVCLLAAGTDGSDGPGNYAGACVDGGTVARGEKKGFSAVNSLKSANSGAFLTASEDLIRTGPTGTNVMDMILGLKNI